MLNSCLINPMPYNSLTLNGVGSLSVTPDLVLIRLGIETRGESLTQVQEENATISNNILEGLNQLGIEDIETYQYFVDRVFDYQDGTAIDRGYIVRNIFHKTSNNIQDAGLIIDTAVAHGSNVVEFISFQVSDVDAYYKKALSMAVKDVVDKAQYLEEHNNIVSPSILKITENSSPPISFSNAFTLREGSTPIQPGTQEIQANVTVEFTF